MRAGLPRAGFFAQLGMFVVPGFFDTESCARLRREMRCSQTIPAPIHDKQNQVRVDEDQRKTEKALMSQETQTQVLSRLMSLRPSLESHFRIGLAGCQPLSFLVYKEGYSFGRHTDTSHDPGALALVRERRVSVSVFLNGEGEADDPDSYGGGALTFHGVSRDQSHTDSPGLSLIGEEGLLIAFRSDWPHAVGTINRGVRFSIVTWFT